MTDQASLSRFFKPKSPSRPPIRPTPIVIDGSDSDDEDPASSSKRPLSPTAVAVAAADSRPGHARKRTKVTGDLTSWYFDAKATPSTSTSHHTPAEALSPSQKKFRHKFLGDASRSRSSGYLDKDSLYTPQAGSSGIKDPGAEVQKLRKAKVSYTPLEQQWLDLKEAHADTLLVLQSGYKFKFYGEDAITASRLLNIAAFKEKHLMSAMIPEHRISIHIKRLLQAGHKVGIVRQVETAALKKAGANKSKLFERKLTELYTLATWVDDLDVEDQPADTGSICCLVESEQKSKGTDELVRVHLATFQPATGEVIYDCFEDGFIRSNLEGRLLHLKPTELLLPEGVSKGTKNAAKLTLNPLLPFPLRIDAFTPPAQEKAYTRLESLLGDRSDAQELLERMDQTLIVVLSTLAKHLKKFALESLFKRAHFRPFHQAASMTLQTNTLTNLEIFNNSFDHGEYGSLFWLLNRCKTSFGKRRLRSWIARPLVSLPAILARQECIEEIIEAKDYKLGKIKNLLSNLPDLEKGLARVHCARIKPPELLRLLLAFHRVSEEFSAQEASAFKSQTLTSAIASLPVIQTSVDNLLSFVVRKAALEGSKSDMFGSRYDEISEAKDHVGCVEVELQQELKNIRSILKKRDAQFVTIAGEEYLVEVQISESSKIVPSDWLRINSTKYQHRYRSPRVIELVAELEQTRERLQLTAEQCYKKFLGDVSDQSDKLGDVVRRLAEVDCLFALAGVATKDGYVKPTFTDHPASYLDIHDARHPIVEEVSNAPHVPNDIQFPGQGQGPQTLILTGLNMGGKSTFSRTIGLSVILAQIGCWVPASKCHMSVFDGVYTRMGASDELSAGRSTFMVELSETSAILKSATSRSLCIIDELGRGTSTTDGLGVALAVLQRLADLGCAHIFITHYAQLLLNKELEQKARSAHMAFVEEDPSEALPTVHFLYKLKIGASGKSHGLNVARLAGLPPTVMSRARTKAIELESLMENRVLRNRVKRLLHALQEDGEGDERGARTLDEAAAVLNVLA